jgi:hypothetical protein
VVPSTSPENKKLTIERIFCQSGLDMRAQRVHSFARMQFTAYAQVCAEHGYAESGRTRRLRLSVDSIR